MHHTIDQITKTTNCAEFSFFASRMSYFPLFSSKQDIRCIDAYLNTDLSHINKLNCVECLGYKNRAGYVVIEYIAVILSFVIFDLVLTIICLLIIWYV